MARFMYVLSIVVACALCAFVLVTDGSLATFLLNFLLSDEDLGGLIVRFIALLLAVGIVAHLIALIVYVIFFVLYRVADVVYQFIRYGRIRV